MRIFAAFRHFNWENHNLEPALRELGDVVRYDWHPPYDQYDPGWHYGLKGAMNRQMLERVAEAVNQGPVDVFYGYLSGRLIHRGYIEAIRMLRVPTLNMTLDDKTHRYSTLEPTGFAGMVDIVSAFDLCWTSDPTAVEWYERHGARAIYLPAGANPDIFVPEDRERDIDVLFVGKCYGRREQIIGELRNAGIRVATYGDGWAAGPVSTAQMVELMNRAQITLGIGETAEPTMLSLKGRDFEAPMCGAFYLPQCNPELWQHYERGFDMAAWDSVPHLIELCRHYLTHPQEAKAMRYQVARTARARHTWRHRFEAAFGAMGVL